jgi:sugar phosphate isomerase/epimerase
MYDARTKAPLPILGAAMPISALPEHLDWIMADQRDLELQDFVAAEMLEGDWRAYAAEARRLLNGHSGRLGIHGPFWGFSIATQDPGVAAVVRLRMDQGLSVCAELGATQMVIHSPYTTWDHQNLDNIPGAREGLVGRVHDVLAPAVKRAEALGVALVIENIEDCDPALRVELARSFASKAVKVSIDTGHAHYAHASTGAPPVDYYVKAAGDMLDHVHVQDADGYADRHWEPGMGTVNWPAVFAALGALDVTPRLNLELRDKSRNRAGAAWLEGAGLAR